MAAHYDRKDHLYTKAKEEGYLSRAAYKLMELQQSYRLIAPNSNVLDLGAWPGGWTQVALGYVSAGGSVTAIDLVEVDGVGDPRLRVVVGDARDLSTLLNLEEPHFDVVISDMSPKLTGIREADQAGTVACAELALDVCSEVLKTGGNFVVKVFKGSEVDAFVRAARPMFNKLHRTELKSSRNTSNEFYVVGLGFKRPNPKVTPSEKASSK